MNNYKNYIDYLFFLRGFLAFLLVPITFLLNIEPFNKILLYSNVYLNNYRFPNLNEPFYYCSLYFFSTFLFIIFYNFILKKIKFENNLKIIDKIKNINVFFIYIFAIILFLKLRILYNVEYLDNKNFLGDLLINNFYTNIIIHFFLPNEFAFIFLSFYYDKIIKNKLINSLFIIYITLTLMCTLTFGSRFLIIVSLIMTFFLLFKFLKNIKYFIIIILFLISFIFLYTFIPYDAIFEQPTTVINNIIKTFEHLIWRLDMFHLIDLGYSSGDLNVIDNNAYGRKVGIIATGDTNTGIEFAFFFDYIKIDNSFLANTLIIIVSSFFVSIFYTILKLISVSFGNFFFIVFLLKFIAHWSEMGIDQMPGFVFKLLIVIFLIGLYIFFEKKILINLNKLSKIYTRVR